MNLPDSPYDQDLTDLLVAYDAELANGRILGGRYLHARLRGAPPELRQRFERARACLLMIERVWPRSGLLAVWRAGEASRCFASPTAAALAPLPRWGRGSSA
jgi:hypothetical protein